MAFKFSADLAKDVVFVEVATYLASLRFNIINVDESRPWGGFFVIDESQSGKFIDTFFDSADKEGIEAGQRISPKILIVQPDKKLSWQYHHRRSELWKVIGGPVAVVRSDNDNQKEQVTYDKGTLVQLAKGERHRLVGLKNWGVIAEIWQHTEIDNPSDEEDIVRVQDDFGR